MRRRTTRMLLSLIAMILAFATGNTVMAAEKETITITDLYGKEKTIRLPVERVIIMTGPVPFQVIRLLGTTDKVVGVNTMVNESRYLYAGYEDQPIVANAMSGAPDYERILSLKPDLILAAFWFDESMESFLEPDVQVVRFDIGPPLSYAKDVRTLAKIMGKQQNAEAFISWFEEFVSNIESTLKTIEGTPKPEVFDFYGGENGRDDGPTYGTYGIKNQWVTPLIEMAGGSSVTKNLQGDWIIVDPEWVINENPAIIVREFAAPIVGRDIIGYDATKSDGLKSLYNKLVTDSPLSLSAAAKTGRVHFIDSGMMQTQWFLALPYLVKWFYPDHFAELNPGQFHQEYLTRFLSLDYQLDQKGVFVFPD